MQTAVDSCKTLGQSSELATLNRSVSALAADVSKAQGAADAAIAETARQLEDWADCLDASEEALRRDFRADLAAIQEELQHLCAEHTAVDGGVSFGGGQADTLLQSLASELRTELDESLRSSKAGVQAAVLHTQQQCHEWVDAALQKLEGLALRTREKLAVFSEEVRELRGGQQRELQGLLEEGLAPLERRLADLDARLGGHGGGGAHPLGADVSFQDPMVMAAPQSGGIPDAGAASASDGAALGVRLEVGAGIPDAIAPAS
eukprot:CAMPEP_0183592144 /NCGR_PEP_ID=MMETSP0371-20130417/167480_1 /TAXON_ID=268820 /ORGANISM="Peridinium aciculiferum, Strain PAER-2" /LENGTH=261 /DNA_ID=CAMNT_0025803647 /DNA_START=69 /DNA_END=851 /DNA_ORIENTATION=-